MALEVTDGNIEEVLTENNIIILDFWAPWCGPCRMLGPIIDELSDDNADIVIGKINVDENRETALKYSVRSIPMVLFIKDGEIVDKFVGAKSKTDIQNKIDELKA